MTNLERESYALEIDLSDIGKGDLTYAQRNR